MYTYRCLDQSGNVRDGLLDVGSEETARRQLAGRGWRVLTLAAVEGSLAQEAGPLAPAPAPVKERPAPAPVAQVTPLSLRDRSLFTLQLVTLLAAGVTIIQSLDAVARSSPPAVEEACERLRRSVNSGRALSESMTGSFGPVFVCMVRIGEHTGMLVECLRALADNLTVLERRRSELLSALMYPLFVLGAAGAMAAFLAFYMLPQFLGVYGQSPEQLPALTRAVLAVSQARWLGWVALATAALTLAWWFVVGRTPAGQLILRRVLHNVPLLGPVLEQSILIGACRNLAMMLEVGLPVHLCLDYLVSPTTGSQRLDEAFQKMSHDLQKGHDLGQTFVEAPHLPGLLKRMVACGDEVGKVPRFLRSYADLSDEQLNLAVKDFLQMVEPLVLGGMGLLVGVLVLSAFLPIYQMISTL